MSQETTALSSLEEIKSLTVKLQQERTDHLNAAANLEKGLKQLRDEVSKILGSDTAIAEPPASAPAPKPKKNKPKAKKLINRIGNTRSRKGEMSGTQKIANILLKHDKKMEVKALRAEAVKAGVAHPHSAMQSLTRSKTITIIDGYAILNEKVATPEPALTA